MADPAKILADLEAKHKAATPGPWKYEPGGGHAPNRIVGSDGVQTEGWREPRGAITNRSYSERVCENLGNTDLDAPAANVALICFMHNHAPLLLAALRFAAARLALEAHARKLETPQGWAAEWERLDDEEDSARAAVAAALEGLA